MKILALSITLLGIFTLIVMLNLSSLKAISYPTELSNLEDNTKVQTQGRVISEIILYEDTKLIKLDNGIELLCDACPSYFNRTLTFIGYSKIYINRTQINILRVIPQ